MDAGVYYFMCLAGLGVAFVGYGVMKFLLAKAEHISKQD
jgi:hypothetical protein